MDLAVWLRKVIDTINDLDNVLYEIANEAHASTADWQFEMIRYIQEYEAKKPNQHPVGMTCRGDEPDNEVLYSSPADWVSPGTYKLYAHSPPAADGRKVSILDTDHVFGVGGDRRWIWMAFTRGHNPIYMDPLWGYIPDKRNWAGQAARSEDARRAMGQTRRFAQRMNLAVMTPQPDLSSTGYCLACAGAEYLVYQPDPAAAFTVDLPAGSYRYEWFNPRQGNITSEALLSVETGRHRFQASFDSDSVLYLKRSTTHP